MRALSLGAVVAIGVGALFLTGRARTNMFVSSARPVAGIDLGDKTQPPEAPQAAGIDPKVLGTYAGRYRLDGPQDILDVTGETLLVASEDGRLFIEGKQGKPEMLPESEVTFRVPQYRTTVTFVREENGQVNRMVVNLMGLKELSARRIE